MNFEVAPFGDGYFLYPFSGGDPMRKLKKYKPTPFMAEGSHYDKAAADY